MLKAARLFQAVPADQESHPTGQVTACPCRLKSPASGRRPTPGAAGARKGRVSNRRTAAGSRC